MSPEISKTAKASMVRTTETKADPFATNEQKIAELRKQRAAKLAIVRYDFIDALIEEFDKVLTFAKETNERLEAAEDALDVEKGHIRKAQAESDAANEPND